MGGWVEETSQNIVKTVRLIKCLYNSGGYIAACPCNNGKMITLRETNIAPEKIGHPKRKLVFQPSIFRRYVSFREGMTILLRGKS